MDMGPALLSRQPAGEGKLRARIIEALMCDFRVSRAELLDSFAVTEARLDELFAPVAAHFGDMVRLDADCLSIPEKGRPLTRMIVRMFDAYDLSKAGHSSAI